MSGRTRYLNTDLDLASAEELTEFIAALEKLGMFLLHAENGNDGLWHARLETSEQYSSPEPNIAAILSAIEALPEPFGLTWAACRNREFNIGYDCGNEPRVFEQELTTHLLGRLAASGASVRITMYGAS